MLDPDNKPLRKPHKRPEPRMPLAELINLRLEKFGDLPQREFAKLLGVTRLHVTSIEQGRRQPSLELALRWVKVLAPKARISMFGPLPVVEARIRQLKRLQKISPEFFKAA